MIKEVNKEIDEFYHALMEHVKKMRKERKISQLKLANILGHNSTSFIARIELRQNNANYNLAHLVILAHEWNLSVKVRILCRSCELQKYFHIFFVFHHRIDF